MSRILVMTDSPNIPTGMGRVGREIAVGLQKRGHQIGYLGWWHTPGTDPNPPAGITYWATNNERYGQDVFDNVIWSFRPDIVLTIGDFWHLAYLTDPNRCRTRRLFQWCSYIPVDGEPIGGGIPPQIRPVIDDIDIPVAYTEYAKQAVLKTSSDKETRNRIRVIYHGVDTKVFKPLDPAKRRAIRERMGFADKFIVLTVCRNQSRKNIPEMFRAWKEFAALPEAKDKVVFWPHMNFKDSMGWDIDDLISVLGMRDQNSVAYFDSVAHGPSSHDLLPEEKLAEVYQIADAFMLISGEGFGLPIAEAMATGLPCIILDHSAPAELGAGGRAELVPVAGEITWTGWHLTQRPLARIDDIVTSLKRVYSDRVYARKIAQAGRDFITQYTWDRVLDEWHMLFTEHEIPFVKPLQLEKVI